MPRESGILQPWEDEESSLPRETRYWRLSPIHPFWFENQIERHLHLILHSFGDPWIESTLSAGLWSQCNWHAWLKSPRGGAICLGMWGYRQNSESSGPRFLSALEDVLLRAGLVFYSRPSSRKFISNFSRVARLCYCCGVTDPVKPFWQAELKQLRRHISLDKEASFTTGFSAAVWQMMRMIIIP